MGGKPKLKDRILHNEKWYIYKYVVALRHVEYYMNCAGGAKEILYSGIISTLYGNIYSLVIGKFYTSADLGVFNRGQNIALLPPKVISSTFRKSTLPILSSVQDNKEHLTHVYRQYGILLSFISYPLVFMTIVLAKPFILLFLTSKWAEAIIYVQLFALTGLTIPMGVVSLNVLQATGRSDYTLRGEIIKKSVGFAVVALLCPISPMALAYGVLGIEAFIYGVNLYYARKVLDLPFFIQFKDPLPYFYASCITGLCVWASIYLIPDNLLKLLIGSITGIAIYFLITKYIIKVKYYDYLLSVVKKREKREKTTI